MQINKLISRTLTYVIPMIGIIYGLIDIILNRNIYSITRIPFTSNYVHSYSLICFISSYILFQITLKHLPIFVRFIVSLLILSTHGYVGGLIWDFNNLAINGVYNIMILIDMAVIVWFFVILKHMDKRYPILKKELSNNDITYTIILFFLQSFGYILLYVHGFWSYFAIGFNVISPDPNANIYWLIMRTTTFFMFYFFLQKGDEENYSLEPPRLI